ncbi:chemotaxis response regulator CheY [Candidatus Sumerlaeota bacterium]|nr:chemotaxis response regulator CheY [Candidatus Sumerlaeota bacterium]
MPDLKMKILVVDDFKTMRRIVRTILTQLGYTEIDEADNGESALAKLRTKKFDLIISDWNMPKMTGLDLLRVVRADKSLANTPFLMVTAEAQQSNIVEALEAKVSNYIVKPFTADVLREKIDKIFPD